MTDIEKSKQVIQNFVQAVWSDRNLAALKDFWTEDCINHAMLSTNNVGIDALRVYHESFFDDVFAAFPDIKMVNGRSSQCPARRLWLQPAKAMPFLSFQLRKGGIFDHLTLDFFRDD